MRVLLGFLVAPLAAPLAIGAYFILAYALQIGWFRGRPLYTVMSNLWLEAAWSCALAYAAAIVLGIPAYLIARRQRWLSLGQSTAIGSAVALLPLTILFAVWVVQEPDLLRSTAFQGTMWLLLFAYCGAACGALFWTISIRGRQAA